MFLEDMFDDVPDAPPQQDDSPQPEETKIDKATDDNPLTQSSPTSVYVPSPLSMTKPLKQLYTHQDEMWSAIDAFEKRAWNARLSGIKTGWADLDAAFEGGLKTGWILVGGSSNIGKTSYLSQLGWSVAHANNDVYVLDFSLDDPMHDKIPRVVASANKVIINAVSTPHQYKQFPDMIKRRNKGLEMLYNAVDRYRVLDANHSTDIDIIEETIKKTLVHLQEEADDLGTDRRRLVVLIDNFHDLSTSSKEASLGDKNKFDFLAQRVSDMATKYDIPIITTGEFKKLNGFRRPVLDDLRESVKIQYEAKAVLLCYNEVGLKGEAASIYYDRQGKAAKQPIFEVSFAKNKMGSFKGRLFYEFYPELAYFDQADRNSVKKYNNLIYSS